MPETDVASITALKAGSGACALTAPGGAGQYEAMMTASMANAKPHHHIMARRKFSSIVRFLDCGEPAI
jgi:uncharacterized membrane protein YbhN (UPF0104 family)